jgi:hypothetical protein
MPEVSSEEPCAVTEDAPAIIPSADGTPDLARTGRLGLLVIIEQQRTELEVLRRRVAELENPLVAATLKSSCGERVGTVVDWGGKKMRVGRCPPGQSCLACERLGKHLEPLEVDVGIRDTQET